VFCLFTSKIQYIFSLLFASNFLLHNRFIKVRSFSLRIFCFALKTLFSHYFARQFSFRIFGTSTYERATSGFADYCRMDSYTVQCTLINIFKPTHTIYIYVDIVIHRYTFSLFLHSLPITLGLILIHRIQNKLLYMDCYSYRNTCVAVRYNLVSVDISSQFNVWQSTHTHSRENQRKNVIIVLSTLCNK